MSASLSEALRLPCGQVLPNRLAKAAMTEGLGDPLNRATERHIRLYKRWADAGMGLLLSGNIQIDRKHLERAGNVVIDGAQSPEQIAALKAWTTAAKSGGAQDWAQIAHSGRQTPKAVNPNPSAPSAVKLALPGGQFGDPRAMTGDEVKDTIRRFAHTAAVAKAVRAKTGGDFAVSVKLNSADFQKGGFTSEECLQVVAWLNDAGIDLLEISGGSYEQPKMAGVAGLEPAFEDRVRASTRAREAYFIDYAAAVAKVARMPLMVTGGFRTRVGMEEAMAAGATQVIGIGRPVCGDPLSAKRLLSGEAPSLPAYEKRLRVGPGWLGPNSPITLLKMINGWGAQGWYCLQLLRMGDGLEPDLRMTVLQAFRRYAANENAAAQALKR
jgi:2,4-dienoyl-CoA reductase-like NADH-dependent reductase (Old Yellow Enzyme family)